MALSTQISGIPDNIKGTRFENISNPYSSLPRTQTYWDRFLNWLGFRSGYDKAQEQYNQSYNEYNAQLSQLASEEEYNTPLKQSQRMRQAGLNPDLLGVSGEPASEFDNQQSSPDISAGTDVNPFDVIQSVGRGFISAITGCIGILSDVNSLNLGKLAFDSNDLDYQSKMLQFFKDSDPLFRDPSEFDSDSVTSSIARNGFFRSSRNLKRFNRLRGNSANSLLGLTTSYNSYDDFAKSAERLGNSISQPYFNGFASFNAKDIADFLKPISKAQMDLILAQTKADNAKAYKDFHKEGFEGDTFAELNKDSSNAKLNAEVLKSDMNTRLQENSARQSIAPMTVTKNQIINKMIQSINKIPDKTIGHSILKFFLINQLSSTTGIGLSDVAGIASKVL